MRFLLIYPPPESYFIRKSKVFYGLLPPLGLLYLSKILQNDGDSVTVFDFSAEPYNEDQFTAAVCSSDIVGLTLLSPSLDKAKQLIARMKQQRPHIPLLIGGPHCTLRPKEALQETGASVCVIGDGEAVITDIKKAFEGKKQFSEIPGIMFQTPQGIQSGQPPGLIEDLDSIPFPARPLVQHAVYGREFNPSLKAGEFTSIITSRGCPYRCRFCSRSSLNKQKYRMRSIGNIIAELKEIQAQGYRHVAIADDCFPVNRKQAFGLFDALIQENLKLTFSVTASRVDFADEDLYHKMRKAGVVHLQFGLESGNQDVLDYYDKQTTIKDIQTAVRLSNQNGFFTIGSFILGAPFETKKHFQQTVRFAQSLRLDSVSFLPLRYMVGSDLWHQAVREGKINENEFLVVADKNRGLGLYTKEELYSFCTHAQRSFYSRPAFIMNLLKKSLRNNDMSFVKSYLSILFSAIRRSSS